MRTQINKRKVSFVIALGISVWANTSLQAQEQIAKHTKTVVIPANSFANQTTFDQHWNYLYPWGDDHNGTARMKREKVHLVKGELQMEATRLETPDGNSSKDPHLPIYYHAGAIHAKAQVEVSDQYPMWELTGEFQAPIAPGTWPAFWISGVNSWPPESDILEFKGDDVNWQNTVDGRDWRNTQWQTEKTALKTADQQWHRYSLIMKKHEGSKVELQYYIDDELRATHIGAFADKPFYIIINLQMEGASGTVGSGPKKAVFKARNVAVNRYSK